jgi:hypothetical protein
MRRVLLGLLILVPALAAADEVRLQNGKVFEGVIAVEHGDVVEVRIPGGSLSLPRSSVREIVRSSSPYGTYLERSAELRGRDAGAEAWFELAKWARRQELGSASREAALAAAELDPSLEGLAPFLRAMGYELDETERVWVPLAEAMRRKGLVLAGGRWMNKAEAAEFNRQIAEEARARRRELEADRLERATAEARLAAAEMELSRAADRAPAPYIVMPNPYLWPMAIFPGYWPPAIPVPVAPEPNQSRPPQAHRGTLTLDLMTRQPGSLFPGELDSSRSSSSSNGR